MHRPKGHLKNRPFVGLIALLDLLKTDDPHTLFASFTIPYRNIFYIASRVIRITKNNSHYKWYFWLNIMVKNPNSILVISLSFGNRYLLHTFKCWVLPKCFFDFFGCYDFEAYWFSPKFRHKNNHCSFGFITR